ncbi:hypothetical protein ATZ36_13595 [Candidatus Endomicrobiellum trichonymphae]|uniref:Uncharacterized protein n=1 Tax=Endomicrobium trichonymphae TaxID=1408204 RepID=A0A1E5IMI7_ENDTX|nr:hypothetical protein ATZ36_13595 [Candidatus Endomicrobium trichonymphae]
MFFYNPAGIICRRDCLTRFSFIDVTLNRGIIDLYLNNKEDFISKMVFYILNNLVYVFVSMPNILFISKPLYISQSSLSFGLGVFSYANLNFKLDSLQSLSYKAEGTLVGVLPVVFGCKF